MQPDLIQAGEVAHGIRPGQAIDAALAPEQDELFLVDEILGDRRHALRFQSVDIDGLKCVEIMQCCGHGENNVAMGVPA